MLFECNHAPRDMHRQTFPVLYRWDILRVSCLEAWLAGEFARGILTHLCGRLKEEEQIKHKLSTQLKSHVWLQNEPRQVRAMCLSLQRYNKLSGMVCNSLLWLIIERHLASDISSPLFWRPLAKLPQWVFDLCVLMSCRQMVKFMCIYILNVFSQVCVCGEVWPQLHASTSHSKERGLSLQYVWLSSIALQCISCEPV